MKNALQKFGKFLSAMVMPNIGAFIAWGFITALFIPDGWIPNEKLASIHPFMLNYLLPALIAYTGGKMVGGDRGGVMGAIAVMGCVAGSSQPMLMAAMVMGPLSGWFIKKFDELMDGRMPAGFEMLINNFSIGIFGMVLAIVGYYGIGPLMTIITKGLTAGVDFLVDHALLPLVAILVEPAKVLFLNNAINHGVFTPIGLDQAAEAGKSIMYMIETNPGPGLGVLLAYWLCSKNKKTRDSAPGAIIIHFLGGIHEIYFPYILMNPIVILGPIVGNICAIIFFSITKCGLVGPASPGSIIAFLGMAPKTQILLVALGVVIATAVSFAISSVIIKATEEKGVKSLEEAKSQKDTMKAEAKGIVSKVDIAPADVKKIIFACDAGMGSSAMGATKFRNRIKEVRSDIVVKNTSVDNIPEDCDIAVVQATLQERAKAAAPQAKLVIINNFLADPELDALYEQIISEDKAEKVAVAEKPVVASNDVLIKESIKLNQPSVTKEEAIRQVGVLLVERGCVEPEYVDAMIERENLTTTYMGMGIAIPHGTAEAKACVKKTAITMIQYPDGVDFGDEKAQLVFGIAGIGDEHLDLLGKIAGTLDNPEVLEKMKTTDDVAWILETLS